MDIKRLIFCKVRFAFSIAVGEEKREKEIILIKKALKIKAEEITLFFGFFLLLYLGRDDLFDLTLFHKLFKGV